MVTLADAEMDAGDMDVGGLHADWAEEDIDLMVAELIGGDKVWGACTAAAPHRPPPNQPPPPATPQPHRPPPVHRRRS